MDPRQKQYEKDLVDRFWAYAQKTFPISSYLFDRENRDPLRPLRPPVFQDNRNFNVLINDRGEISLGDKVRAAIPPKARHLHFGSMKSSQALAQSVFANLHHLGRLGLLAEVRSEEGEPAFYGLGEEPQKVVLERSISTLGEKWRGRTSIDVWLDGKVRVAVECKFTEVHVGPCSRPTMKQDDRLRYCNGTYSHQFERKNRCALALAGIQYWHFIPQLFNWDAMNDLDPCPLKEAYQLVRCILAVCVNQDATVETRGRHALLVFDNRNPSFSDENGKGLQAYRFTRGSLKIPSLLRRCSWQKIAEVLRHDRSLDWLTSSLESKYGF